ncbi:hypothetical protein [Brachybacterium alimentarium]|uniref:hypothetical protein n=1 Tax=Brachybacterium alimentarium TaxID=47845 RepID=UPI003FBA5508
MTIHRTTLHRPSRRGCVAYRGPRHGAAVEPQSRTSQLVERLGSDRGDVPGWVLITLMTAGIVVALWAVASEQIVQIFENAMAPFLGGSL